MKLTTTIIAFATVASGLAADLPPLVIPEGVGVNIHFTRGHREDLDLIAAAGFKFVRMDFVWAETERGMGELDFSAYDELTENLRKRGLRPVYILDYSNPLYEETVGITNPASGQVLRELASPRNPRSVTAFARWAGAVANHFRGRNVIWEIWNEPNISFWKPKPNVKEYLDLARSACLLIRTMDPGAVIIAPASSEFPWKFLEEFCKSDVLQMVNGASVHPYRGADRPPETAADDYRRLRQLIDQNMPAGARRTLPIISGEWGYATHNQGVPLQTQADYLVRQQLFNLFSGIPLSIWYDWKNDGTDANEREHNFGVVTHDLKPKPAYSALQTMTRELAGYRVERRFEAGGDKDWVLLFRKADGPVKLAVWTTGEAHTLSLKVSTDKNARVAALTSLGETYVPKLKDDLLSLEISATPQYVTLDGVTLAPQGARKQ